MLLQTCTDVTKQSIKTLSRNKGYCMSKDNKKNDSFEKAKNSSQKVVKSVGNAAASVVENTKDAIISMAGRINDSIEEKKEIAEKEQQERFRAAMRPLAGTEAESFIATLGTSPVSLTGNKSNQIKQTFPIPREHNILWADAEFGLRPSGIALTEKGVFIRTNVGMLDGKLGVSNFLLDELNAEEQQMFLQHHAQFHSGKAVLLYYSWNDFDPEWFTSESKLQNKALLVEPQCSNRFIDACRIHAKEASFNQPFSDINVNCDINDYDNLAVNPSIASGAAIESAQSAIFTEQKAHINTPAGHGEMAEEAINMLDRLQGFDAKVIGRNNAKDGADRQIGKIFIQTKYYNSARGSLESCFSPETGQYRYMNDGKPMQLEVPKDQYQKVLDGFKKKIENGSVPGVTDPNEAALYVRKGRLTYQQAVNLTKPGTIESLSYDALTGTVICTCAFGVSFVATVFLTLRKTGDLKMAIQAGASAGLEVFGISFIQHMLVSQIARTGLAGSLMGPSQYIAGKLGYQMSATVVNGIRALSGKSAIYGAAASKHLAKILRSNVVTSALSFAVFSLPETYNVVARKISGAQYMKNMSVLGGAVVAGAGGALATGILAAKVAGTAGTAVAPGVGTVVGIAGGFVGGTIGAKLVKVAGDVLHEDDVGTHGRMFNAYVSCMINEYLLDEEEIDALITKFNRVDQKKFKILFENIQKAKEQELVVREFLAPYFEGIVLSRPQFHLPTVEDMIEAMADLIVEELAEAPE